MLCSCSADALIASITFDDHIRIWTNYTNHDNQSYQSESSSYENALAPSQVMAQSLLITSSSSAIAAPITAATFLHKRYRLMYHPDGSKLIVAKLRSILVFNMTLDSMHEPELIIDCHADSKIQSICYNHDYTQFITGHENGLIQIWCAWTGKLMYDVIAHFNAMVLSIHASPCGRFVASCGSDNTLRIADASDGKLIHQRREHLGSIYCVQFSPDSNHVATASQDTIIRIWDVVSGASRLHLDGHKGWVVSVCYSPDGLLLASASRDYTAMIWNAVTGESLHTLSSHYACVLDVAFNFDGTRLATAGEDSCIRFWDSSTGLPVGNRLDAHAGAVVAIAFAPAVQEYMLK